MAMSQKEKCNKLFELAEEISGADLRQASVDELMLIIGRFLDLAYTEEY